MAMKKRKSAAMFCLLFVAVVFFVLEIHLSAISKLLSSRSTTSIIIPGTWKTKQRENRKMDLPVKLRHGGKISCDRSHSTYDFCTITGPTVLDPTTSTMYLKGPTSATSAENLEKIRPYPRKAENSTMSRIKEMTLAASSPLGRECQAEHESPAMVFSAGGYTGNFFHDFNDGFIPLFITVNSIFPDGDFVLVVSKARDWWVSKYAKILQAFSKHRIIALENDSSIHCFPSASIGLISHGFMTIDSDTLPNSKSFMDFHYFLDKAFSCQPSSNPACYSSGPSLSRPRLIFVSRTGNNIGRVILNQNEVTKMAEHVGFEVIVFEPTDRTSLPEAYKLMNSSHAMVGVHGAALTHFLFMRPGSVLVQIVPIGLRWVSQVCFEKPARAMGLDYMEYRVGLEESSLVDKYGKEDLVIKDPLAFRGQKWSNMNVYLKEQDVRLGLIRFREYLKEMYNKAIAFMEKEG